MPSISWGSLIVGLVIGFLAAGILAKKKIGVGG